MKTQSNFSKCKEPYVKCVYMYRAIFTIWKDDLQTEKEISHTERDF